MYFQFLNIFQYWKLQNQRYVTQINKIYKYYLNQEKVQKMNSLVYNPNITHIPEWTTVYLSQNSIKPFQNIIERTCSSLSVTSNDKMKKLTPLNSMNSKIDVQSPAPKPRLGLLKRKISIRNQGGIQRLTEQIKELKGEFVQQYQQIFIKQKQKTRSNSRKVDDSLSILQSQSNKINQGIEICEKHLKEVKTRSFSFYDQFIDQEGQLLQAFVFYKLSQLKTKLEKVHSYLNNKNVLQLEPKAVQQARIVYDNLFIETQYLRIFTHKNTQIYEMHTQNEHSAEQPQMIAIRRRQFKRLKKCQEQIQALKKRIRELYFQHYRKKKGRQIKDHQKLQMYIRNENGVNKSDFQEQSSLKMWVHGFIFGILIISLAGIIILRQTNIVKLQLKDDYAAQFQVWRGASYLISFNWVLAFVTYLYRKLGINYRMILLQENHYLERPESFFWSASLLSVIYLVLFLVYLLHQLNYIVGYDHLAYLGYYMWAINILFMLNPLKILNYHSRIYFMDILFKNLQLLWRPINFNLFLLGMIMGSFAQPINDCAFAACQLIYNDKSRCSDQGRNATFIYLIVYIFYRIIQSFRLHYQYSADVCISRARQGLTACIFSLNTVISSYLYGTYKTNELLHYWIASACISTLTGTNADLRADWGVISLDQQDCMLRRYKMFKRWIYFFCAVLDLLLNVVWALTISTQIADYLNINILYFFLLLQNLQFVRRGMWMLFRIEDDHMQNVGTLNAMADDSQHINHLDLLIQKEKNKLQETTQMLMNQSNSINQGAVKKQRSAQDVLESVLENQVKQEQEQKKEQQEIPAVDLKQLQVLILKKQERLVKVQNFTDALEGYLRIIHQLYQTLQWQDQY